MRIFSLIFLIPFIVKRAGAFLLWLMMQVSLFFVLAFGLFVSSFIEMPA